MRKLLLGALLVLVLLPMSVSAAGNATNLSVEGNIYGPVFSIEVTMGASPAGWGLAFGDNSWFTSPGVPSLGVQQGPPPLGLTVTAHAQNNVPFSVSASDKLDFGKPSASKGKMAEYTVCWTHRQPIAMPEIYPPMCTPGGLGVPGNCTMTTNRWEPSGKTLTFPLVLNETVILAVPPAEGVFKKYNMTGTDPILFTGVGDTMPPLVPGGNPILGPGTSRNYDVRQRITLADSPVRVDPYPTFPTVAVPGTGLEYQQIHSYKMPLTFTLTTL